MTETTLLAVVLATLAGIVTGRAWASARRRMSVGSRFSSRASVHFAQGLHYLSEGRFALAVSELVKVYERERDSVELALLVGNLLRETGQVERAIRTHRHLAERPDLTRAERAHALACVGMDYRAAGFLDRARRSFREVLDLDPNNLHSLLGMARLEEDERHWEEAYKIRRRLGRLRRDRNDPVLAHLQAELGREALRLGQTELAEQAFRRALRHDRSVVPARLGLAAIIEARDARAAVADLEDFARSFPDKAHHVLPFLDRLYAARGTLDDYASLCEELIARDPRGWRVRVALAQHLSGAGRHEEALGLVQRALDLNPHAPLVHVTAWRCLRALGMPREQCQAYGDAIDDALVGSDPHVCSVCGYRADEALWRCPHCHEWGTLVEPHMATPGRA
jgi:lipopolysaccharide biosynthesis regulator YciM